MRVLRQLEVILRLFAPRATLGREKSHGDVTEGSYVAQVVPNQTRWLYEPSITQ